MSDELPDSVVIGAVGEPGQRTFLLQVRQLGKLITAIVEKQQVAELSQVAFALLAELGQLRLAQELIRSEGGVPDPHFETDEPLFRVSSFELGFDSDANLVILAAEPAQDDVEPLRLQLSLTELGRLATQGAESVARGRPICPICGLPMEADGHICPAVNGHRPRTA